MDAGNLKRWNPWWAYGKVPNELLGMPRKELLERLINLSKAKEVVGVTGVRRSGKSTALYQLIDSLMSEGVQAENILYFNFDEPYLEKNMRGMDELYNLFLETNNPQGRQYLFLDEIQNIPEWERWVKTQYDLLGNKIKFYVTGSNTSMLSDSLAKLLTGRMLAVNVYPLSFKEYVSFKGTAIKDIDLQKNELKHLLMRYAEEGGFPETALEKNKDLNFQRLREYYNSILFRDVVSTRKISESAKLAELSEYAATNIASLHSYNSMSKAINLNINTLKEYLHYLEQAYLVFQAGFFSYSLKESLAIQKPKKIYFIDTGMRNSVAARFSQDAGRLAENMVFLELKRRGYELSFWKGANEVDFIARSPERKLSAINVTYGKTIDEREEKGLLEFRETHKQAKLIILTKDTEKTSQEIKYTPIWKWLLTQ